MNPASYPIETLIPQREPIIMVDRVLDYTERTITTSFYVNNTNLLVENGLLTESGLLENIAQTAAAKVGLACKIANAEVPIGYIGSINKVTLFKQPKAGETITTFVEVQQEIFNVTLIAAKSMVGDDILLTCQMKIVINP